RESSKHFVSGTLAEVRPVQDELVDKPTHRRRCVVGELIRMGAERLAAAVFSRRGNMRAECTRLTGDAAAGRRVVDALMQRAQRLGVAAYATPKNVGCGAVPTESAKAPECQLEGGDTFGSS